MAIMDCINCRGRMSDSDKKCPECETPNYLLDNDPKVMLRAVEVFVEQENYLNDQDKKAEEKVRHKKMKELERLRPPTLVSRFRGLVFGRTT